MANFAKSGHTDILPLSLSLFNMCSPRNESPINTHLSHESNEQTCSILDTVILSNLTLSPIYQHPQTHFKYRHSAIQLPISVAEKITKCL